jgi:hypothetical protein
MRDLLDLVQATIDQLKQVLRTQGGYLDKEITPSPTRRKVADIFFSSWMEFLPKNI